MDLSALAKLNRMANSPDPRDFYRVSRVVLMPSLSRESLGRVAMEAMAKGGRAGVRCRTRLHLARRPWGDRRLTSEVRKNNRLA